MENSNRKDVHKASRENIISSIGDSIDESCNVIENSSEENRDYEYMYGLLI